MNKNYLKHTVSVLFYLWYLDVIGEYSYEESQNGGRYKKSIRMGNQTCLLLIRDESGPPTKEVCLSWAHVLIFVWSVT